MWVSTDASLVDLNLLGLTRPGAMTPVLFGDDRGLLVVLAFESYTGPGGSVTVHIRAFRRRWASRDLLNILWHYSFVTLRVAQIVANIPEANVRARRFVEHLGFKLVARLDGYFPNGGLCVYYGHADSLARWAPRGKAETSCPAALREDARIVRAGEYAEPRLDGGDASSSVG